MNKSHKCSELLCSTRFAPRNQPTRNLQKRSVLFLHLSRILDATLVLVLSHFSHVRFFATLWTVARQAPLSVGLPRQEYWSELLPGASTGDPTHDKVMWKRPDGKVDQDSRDPQTCSSIYPKTRICLSYYVMPFTNSSGINRGLSPARSQHEELRPWQRS